MALMHTDSRTGPDPALLLGAMRAVALRVDESFSVTQRIGGWIDVELGADIRDAVPALVGMETMLIDPSPELDLPFVTLGGDDGTVVSLSAFRNRNDQALWIVMRDASEEAALQGELLHRHNALAIAQREVAKARDEAQAANRAKSSFLANVSHELRSPLHVVIGGAEVLLRDYERPLAQEEMRAFASDIRASGKLLLELVKDLIDLSRAEIGALTLQERPTVLAEIVDEAVTLAQGLPGGPARRFGSLDRDRRATLPPVLVDPLRIKQILINLLSNAVKATAPDDAITVGAYLGKGGDIVIEVADTGPGMSPEALKIALEHFGQPDERLRGLGAGLGLSIVDRLAAAHDGRFEIETAPGEGLHARAILPARRCLSADGSRVEHPA